MIVKKYCLLLVTLATASSFAQNSVISKQESFKTYTDAAIGSMPAFNIKQETEGSPFYLRNWSTGKVVLNNKRVLVEEEQILNYDKLNQTLLMRSNNKLIAIGMDDIASFDLVDSSQNLSFVRAPFNVKEFAIAIVKDSLFSLYKTVKTTFHKSDYVNKGLYENGYKYDRYVDETTYYIVQKSGLTTTFKNLSRKELKQAVDEIPQAKEYLKKYEATFDKEIYLSDLTYFLNRRK